MNNTPTRSDEVDGAFPIHHNVRQKVPDTRRGDDGVQISTPRSRNEVDGALWTVILYHFFFEHLSNHARVSLPAGFLHDLTH